MWNVSDLVARLKEIFDEYGYDLTDIEYRALEIDNKPNINVIYNRLGGWTKAKFFANRSIYDIEIITENVKLAKQRQKFMDSNRIERRSFRDFARIDNALEEYSKELAKILDKYDLSQYTTVHQENKSTNKRKAVGIVHLTDLHANELVDLNINKYDFKIASRRCRKFINKAKEYFTNFDINNVLFAMTGDLTNSDIRLDQLLNEATNRSKATFLTVQIIQQMLIDLNQNYNVSVACVSGNEPRVKPNIAYSDISITDNYDFMVNSVLKYVFRKSEGISFIDNESYAEQVVNIGGQHILLMHGEQIKSSNVEHAIQQIRGKYSARGVIIDFIIYGHLHSCRVGNSYARGGSVVGSNAYSESELQLASRASQNIHIIYSKNERDSIVIDLQDTDDVVGYSIEEELEAYNAKSLEKTRKKKTILEIVI